MRKIFSIQDLRNYLQKENKTLNFSTEAGDPEIVVGVPASLTFSEDKSAEGLLPVTLRACHDKDNLNGSEISKADMKKALKSFRNRPILGYIHQDENGDYQFAGHEMHLSGNDEIVYDEVPVGHTIGSAKLEYDADLDKDFAVIDDAVIYQEYSKAAEILRREGKCDVSVELGIREMSYDAKSKKLRLSDFYCSGITILGYDENGNKVNPAMPGSDITLKDFSQSTDNTKGDKNMNEEIKEQLSENSDNISEESKAVMEEETSAEDISEEKENASTKETESTEENVNEEETVTEEENTEEVATETESTDEEKEEEQFSEDNHTVTYSVNDKSFEISLNDIQYAITELVNNQYGEVDGDYYSCDVFQDSKSIVMKGMFSGKAYRQNYKVRNGEYSLTGDRVEVFAQYLTQDEISALDDMRSKYSVIEEKLNKYEEEPKKLDVLNSSDYSAIADTAEFAALKENHFDMSVEDLTKKANDILLNYAKKNFSKKPETKVRPFPEMPKYNKKKGRYGNLFSKER